MITDDVYNNYRQRTPYKMIIVALHLHKIQIAYKCSFCYTKCDMLT